MKVYLVSILGGLIFFVVGIACLLYPGKVQNFVLTYYALSTKKFNPLSSWMRTHSYMWFLRIIGFWFLIIFIFLIIILCKNLVFGS
jgi:hypothetical protein